MRWALKEGIAKRCVDEQKSNMRQRPFRRFELTWAFDPVPGEGCRVSLTADLELRSRLLRDLFGQSMARAVEGIVAAFDGRARRLYGPPPGTRARPRHAAPIEPD